MPEQSFSVHVDLDDLARRDLAAALARPTREEARRSAGASVPRHGAQDERQAARSRSGRDHAERAAGTGGGRSYAFRRS